MRGKAQNTYKLNSLTRETVGILKSRFENQSNLTNEILKYKNVIIPGLRPTLVAVQPSQIALQLI